MRGYMPVALQRTYNCIEACHIEPAMRVSKTKKRPLFMQNEPQDIRCKVYALPGISDSIQRRLELLKDISPEDTTHNVVTE